MLAIVLANIVATGLREASIVANAEGPAAQTNIPQLEHAIHGSMRCRVTVLMQVPDWS